MNTVLPWQPSIIQYILSHEYAAIFAEMGTGKTYCAVQAIKYWHDNNNNECRQYLIVARQFLYNTWQSEFAKYAPELIVAPVPDMALALRAQFFKDLQDINGVVFLTNYDALFKSKASKGTNYTSPVLAQLQQMKFYACFLDESTRIKTLASSRTKGVCSLRANCARRYIMTGLPNPQSPADFLGQYEFLHPKILGYGSKSAFEQAHANKWGFKIISWRNLDQLQAKVNSCAIILKKEDTAYVWPERRFEKATVELTGDQARIYREMAKEFVAMIEQTQVTASIVLAQAMKLRQITGGWIIDDSGKVQAVKDNAKLKVLLELLELIEKPIIIYSCFRAELEGLKNMLKCPVLHGGISQKQRIITEQSFQKGQTPMLLCHPEVGGIGLNLQTASTIIFYSNDVKNELRRQAMDRIHRIGQKQSSVLYIDIVAQKTIDEVILKSLETKQDLARQLLANPSVVKGGV